MTTAPDLSAEIPAHRTELRLWLRLLTTANTIEAEIRRRLRDRFDTTLPASTCWRSSNAPRTASSSENCRAG